jgi:hypothetical protein
METSFSRIENAVDDNEGWTVVGEKARIRRIIRAKRRQRERNHAVNYIAVFSNENGIYKLTVRYNEDGSISLPCLPVDCPMEDIHATAQNVGFSNFVSLWASCPVDAYNNLYIYQAPPRPFGSGSGLRQVTFADLKDDRSDASVKIQNILSGSLNHQHNSKLLTAFFRQKVPVTTASSDSEEPVVAVKAHSDQTYE